jgi:hypothetical protein
MGSTKWWSPCPGITPGDPFSPVLVFAALLFANRTQLGSCPSFAFQICKHHTMAYKHTCTRGECLAMQEHSRGVVDMAYYVAGIGSQGCWGCLRGSSALLCICMCARHAWAMFLLSAWSTLVFHSSPWMNFFGDELDNLTS